MRELRWPRMVPTTWLTPKLGDGRKLIPRPYTPLHSGQIYLEGPGEAGVARVKSRKLIRGSKPSMFMGFIGVKPHFSVLEGRLGSRTSTMLGYDNLCGNVY